MISIEYIALISVLVLFVITLPGTIELFILTLFAYRPLPSLTAKYDDEAKMKLAIVIPAHNEESGIGVSLESLQACYDPQLSQDIIVIADNCTDTTAEKAAAYGVRVIVRTNDELRGKGYALNETFTQLLSEEKYDAFVVVDADTSVDQNFLQIQRRAFANGCDATQANYRVKNADTNIRTRLMNIAFLAFNHLRLLGRSGIGHSAGILGNGFGLRNKTLQNIPYNSFSIVEDLEYHNRLIAANLKVRYLPQTRVWSDMPDNSEDAESQRARWEGGRIRMIFDQMPILLKRLFQGNTHVWEPILELLLLPLAFHTLLVLIMLVLSFVSKTLWMYASIAFLIVVLHVLASLHLGRATAKDWQALFFAPFYVLWKLTKLTKIFSAAKGNAAWKRTNRKE